MPYCCLVYPVNGVAWKAIVHEVAKSGTQLGNFTFCLLSFQFFQQILVLTDQIEQKYQYFSDKLKESTPTFALQNLGIQMLNECVVKHVILIVISTKKKITCKNYQCRISAACFCVTFKNQRIVLSTTCVVNNYFQTNYFKKAGCCLTSKQY